MVREIHLERAANRLNGQRARGWVPRALLFFGLILVLSSYPLAAQEAQGKIISLQGRVERQPASVPSWSLARILQQLFTADKVRVLDKSRAAILFIDESQIRLNAGAEMTVKAVKTRGGTSSTFQLTTGEGWFRTKNPSSGLSVTTPAVTAAIRGTEIDVRVGSNGDTSIIVVEGVVDLTNDAGKLTVNAGEEATVKPGEAPVKRKVLNPRASVQWVLYYPTDFSWVDYLGEGVAKPVADAYRLLDRHQYQEAIKVLQALAGGDQWAQLGLSGAYLETGAVDQARTVIASSFTGTIEAERLAQSAAIALSSGDVVAARADLEKALAINPKSIRALALLSSIALVQDDKVAARKAAEAALAAQPDSVAANLAMGEVMQSQGNLPGALEHYDSALAKEPGNIRSLVDKARVLFGSDRKNDAQKTMDEALAIVPGDPQVLSLQGFIELSSGNVKDAEAHFQSAIAIDSSFGEPHLGLGLADFKQGKPNQGLEENLIATLLDPQISLYQSYLAKAYYQLRRFHESLAVLDSAKRLDPNDPTPWLYDSVFLADMNRFGDSLMNLRQAIRLNDNRAVYRSRLLLDQDLATKNVSLARSYTKLGLDRWGAYEAIKSEQADYSNASAHIFLAGVYGGLPDRLQAQSSELLQYQLLAPVNRNIFNSFNEYTSLFDQPMFAFELYSEGRYPLWGTVQPLTRSGNDRFAHIAWGTYSYGEGARINPFVPDTGYSGFGQAKIAFSERSDILLNAQYSYKDEGEDQNDVVTYGAGTSHPFNIQTITTTPDPNNSYIIKNIYGLVGFKHIFGTGAPLTAAVQFQDTRAPSVQPDNPTPVTGILLHDSYEADYTTIDMQAQQVFKLFSVNQLITGAEYYYRSKIYNDNSIYYYASDGSTFVQLSDFKASTDTGAALWLLNTLHLWNRLTLTAGIRGQVDVGEHLYLPINYDYPGLYPAIGVSFDLSPTLTLRTAFFQNRSAQILGSQISPTSIVGFPFQRNEEDYTMRSEFDFALDWNQNSFFLESAASYRSLEFPPGSFSLLKTAETVGFDNTVNWMLSRYFSLTAVDNAALFASDPYWSVDNQLSTAITFSHPWGFTLKLTNRLISQAFFLAAVSGLPNSNFDLVDFDFSYILPRKIGTITASVSNILDTPFSTTVSLLAISPLYPYRRITVSVNIRF